MPKISVIVPVYNVEQYLNRCIDSILAQTFRDFEVILVDDGSPDGSPAICDDYQKKYPRIVRTVHKENGGLSSARNAGLHLVSGEYVMFLDSDDHLVPACFERLLSAKKTQDADLVIGSVVYAYEGSDHVMEQAKRENAAFEKQDFEAVIPALLEERRLNYVHGKLYKREVIQTNQLFFEDEKLTSAEDTVFNFTFLKYAKSISICGANVHYYMQHGGGLAGRFVPDRYQRFLRLSDFLEKTCGEMNWSSPELHRAIEKRRVLSAVWCTEAILRASLSKQERECLLEPIFADKKLRAAIPPFQTDETKDVQYLLQNGAGKLVRMDIARKRKAKCKAFFSKITPRFLKNVARKRKKEK